MRRFTRLTNAFSKKVENLHAAVALHFAHYNFVRLHRSLNVTPAMQAGVSKHLWSLSELVERTLSMFTVKWRIFPEAEPGCFGTFQSLPDAVSRAIERFQYSVNIWVEDEEGKPVVQYDDIEQWFDAGVVRPSDLKPN